jgi:hypothetical protein
VTTRPRERRRTPRKGLRTWIRPRTLPLKRTPVFPRLNMSKYLHVLRSEEKESRFTDGCTASEDKVINYFKSLILTFYFIFF